MKTLHALVTLFHVFVVFSILNSIISRASTCDLKKVNRYLEGKENSVYIGRTERKKVIYRGLSVD